MVEAHFIEGPLCTSGPSGFNFIENKWPVLSKRFEFIEVHWHPPGSV